MNRKFIIITSNASGNQADTITDVLSESFPKVWHWIDNTWIVVTDDPFVSAEELWRDKLQANPSLGDVSGVCFEVHGRSEFAGFHHKASWDWLYRNWNAS